MRELLAHVAVTGSGLVLALGGCAPAGYRSGAAVQFESAELWVVQGTDSTRLYVDVADSQREQEVGLSGRSFLPRDGGMLFVFDEERSGEDGFWMVGTQVPLDIAFMDEGGVIRKILEMAVCEEPEADDCPGYFPGVSYRSALEVHRGWFAAHGVQAGARVSQVPVRPSRP